MKNLEEYISPSMLECSIPGGIVTFYRRVRNFKKENPLSDADRKLIRNSYQVLSIMNLIDALALSVVGYTIFDLISKY